jgi:hypothetical protein
LLNPTFDFGDHKGSGSRAGAPFYFAARSYLCLGAYKVAHFEEFADNAVSFVTFNYDRDQGGCTREEQFDKAKDLIRHARRAFSQERTTAISISSRLISTSS